MKKSEMVDKLVAHIMENVGNHSVRSIVEKCVNFVEANGMLPPGREEDKIVFSTMDGTVTGFSYDQYIWDEETLEMPVEPPTEVVAELPVESINDETP